MKKYEFNLLIGTVLTLFGIILLCKIKINSFLSWMIIIIGKIIVIFSVMEYIDYKRMIKGEDLNKDNKFKKIIRKLRRD
ncbi:hypothetical protein DRN73_06895 [Candidatus Pacearchaeota archaeon]|nr:MAG: hypothetical protein DRN73_06895 [Candidatus Pacearchaeota archaeon]